MSWSSKTWFKSSYKKLCCNEKNGRRIKERERDCVCVVHFNQLLCAGRTRKLAKMLFWSFWDIFHYFVYTHKVGLFISHQELFSFLWKGSKHLSHFILKQPKNDFRCAQHPKAGQNAHQVCVREREVDIKVERDQKVNIQNSMAHAPFHINNLKKKEFDQNNKWGCSRPDTCSASS